MKIKRVKLRFLLSIGVVSKTVITTHYFHFLKDDDEKKFQCICSRSIMSTFANVLLLLYYKKE